MLDLLTGLFTNLLWAIIAAVATWLWAQRKIRQLRRQLRTLQAGRGDREVVLIVSVREDLSEAVSAQLARDGRQAMPVFKVHQAGNFTEQENEWMAFVRQVKDEVKKIREQGVSRIYFYTNAPVIMGVFTGALLGNGPEVIMHHYFNGVYRRIGRMTHETVYY